MKLTKESLLKHLAEDLAVDDVDETTELFSTGLLDSVSMLKLITFVEEKAGVQVSQEDVTLDNFDTVTRILTFARSAG